MKMHASISIDEETPDLSIFGRSILHQTLGSSTVNQKILGLLGFRDAKVYKLVNWALVEYLLGFRIKIGIFSILPFF